MKIFLGANIVFSASKKESAISRFIIYLAKKHTVITSDYAEQEAYKNIVLKRPDWLSGYKEITELIQVVPSIDCEISVEIASKDRPIIATAITQKCHFLITGDKKDFGHLFGNKIKNLRIVTPLMMEDFIQ